jgi:hypothetical protein
VPTSIRVGDGVIINEYQGNPGFKNWYKVASRNSNVKFPYDCWVLKTRNRVIHLKGSLQDQIRRRVTVGVTMKKRKMEVRTLIGMILQPTTDCVLLLILIRRKEEML